MRNSIHSIRLAVSFLLGVLAFSAFPVAKPAEAASVSLPIVLPDQPQLASNDLLCTYDPLVKTRVLYASLTSLSVTDLMPYLPQTIASAKEDPRKQAIGTTEPNNSSLPTSTSSPQTSTFQPSQPIVTATPIPQPLVTTPPPQPQAVQAVAGSRLNADVLFSLVNSYRASIGLPPFQQDARIAAVASSRAPELDYEIYGGGRMHAGFYARNLGYWATENMISMDTEQAALNWWLNSPVHRSAIEGNYQYAAVACAGRSCTMIFTNFAPK